MSKGRRIDASKYIHFATGLLAGLALSVVVIAYPSYELGKNMGWMMAIAENMN
jgi:hypothetical protein